MSSTTGTKRTRKPSAQELTHEGQPVTRNIVLCEDGKYRWVYEMNLLKNPTVFLMVWKIFFFIILGIFAFVALSDLFRGGDRLGQALLNDLKMFGYMILGMTVLTVLGVLVYAAIMRGKYIVEFEMDDKGVKHTQIPSQAKKAKKLAAVTAVAGASSGRLTAAGAGMMATRTSMYTAFSDVRKVKAYPRRNIVKLNERLEHNQVYASLEDFDFVYQYILSHCPAAKHG